MITLSNSAIEQRKFTIPFQWGFDGQYPAVHYAVGTDIGDNTQGFDLSSSSTSGSIVFKRAINAVSNPDEFDINMMVLPGVIHGTHTNVTNHEIDKVEDRRYFPCSWFKYNDSVTTVIDNVNRFKLRGNLLFVGKSHRRKHKQTNLESPSVVLPVSSHSMTRPLNGSPKV